ncbi:MAG: hypothetical protein MUC49_21845 [Raineya sp.]|jgi:hypothetical protein|nr:hypothetical protein [Raineya sp.]
MQKLILKSLEKGEMASEIIFEVEEVEYNRAVGVSFSVFVKSFNTQTQLYGHWIEGSNIESLVYVLEKKIYPAVLETSDMYLIIKKSDYSENMAVGLWAKRASGNKLRTFPFSISISFEISKSTLEKFQKSLEKLKKRIIFY